MEDNSTRRYILYGATAGAAAYLWLRQTRKGEQPEATDFDSFLRAPASSNGVQAAPCTSFESFLRSQPDEPNSTDFASFLKNRSTGAQTAGVVQQAPAAQEHIPEDAIPVLVIYGTEYGFAREIAEKLSQQLKETGKYWPTLVDSASHPDGYDMASQQAAAFIFSTQGDGVPPTEARDFCEWLFAGKAGQLQQLAYSVCALGDTAYTHFCRCGKQIDTALAATGATTLTPRVDVDKEDWSKVDAWISNLLSGLSSLAETGALKTYADLGGIPAALSSGSGTDKAAAVGSKKYSKSRPYYARVVAVEGLCVLAGPDDKDTVRLELALEPEAVGLGGLEYQPGDALGIWPTNPPQVVDELLQQLGASGKEAVAAPTWHYAEDPTQHNTAAAADGTVSLRHALSVCYDIKTPKAQQLLQLLLQQLQQQQHGKSAVDKRVSFDVCADASTAADLAAAVRQQDEPAKQQQQQQQHGSVDAGLRQLEHLLTDAAALETYLAARHVVDVLQDFSQVQISYTQLLPLLRPLQPRLYSISSSPLEHTPHNSGVQATIAVVRYESLSKARQGVTSTQVAERLEVGQTLPVFISKNPDFRLPEDPTTPIIMVGPGTGLAPFRSFIMQRLLERDAAHSATTGPMHLFFGCRRRDQDFLYGQQLQAWHDSGAITLHTAFSRETGKKVYVQHRLREAGDSVWEMLQAGGHFYVCGDAGSMAGAVEQALLDIIQQHQPEGGSEGAKAYLEQLASSGRYERDVWFS